MEKLPLGIKNARRFRTRLTQTGAKPAGIFVLAGFTYFFITGRVQKDDISGGIRGGSTGDPGGIQAQKRGSEPKRPHFSSENEGIQRPR